jgi:hypothetical protein
MAGALKRKPPRWSTVKPWEGAFQGWEKKDETALVKKASDEWQTTADREQPRPGEQMAVDRFLDDTLGEPRSAQRSAVCEVMSFTGDVAHCLAEVPGARLPVDVPVWVLRHHALREGHFFEWRMSEDGSIYPQDIRPLPSPRLSPTEEEERQRLWQEYQADPARDVWDNSED